MISDDEVLLVLRPLLFGWHHDGIRDTGNLYPLGAFLLVGATIDVLAGLAYNPDDDSDGGVGLVQALCARVLPTAVHAAARGAVEGLALDPAALLHDLEHRVR